MDTQIMDINYNLNNCNLEQHSSRINTQSMKFLDKE